MVKKKPQGWPVAGSLSNDYTHGFPGTGKRPQRRESLVASLLTKFMRLILRCFLRCVKIKFQEIWKWRAESRLQLYLEILGTSVPFYSLDIFCMYSLRCNN
jgi:hypothetical protein